MRNLLYLSLPLKFILLSSCVASRSLSTEAPNRDNQPSLFGLPDNPTWDEMKNLTANSLTAIPWSDTWWPFPKLGVGHRWTIVNRTNEGLHDTPFSIADMVEEWINAIKDGSRDRIALLSPAEKLALVESSSIPDLQIKLEAVLSQTQHTLSPDLERYFDFYKPRSTEAFQILSEIRTMERLEPESPRIAARYKDLEDLATSLRDARQSAPLSDLKNYASAELQAAAQLEPMSVILADSWRTYSSYFGTKSSAHEWRWMGICHGWSLAALAESAPKHGVLVKKDGLEILFNQGDVRGLLTKVWADQSAPSRFIGKRCEVDYRDLAANHSDSLGRIIDGRICDGRRPNLNCLDGKPIDLIDRDYDDGMITYRSPESKTLKIAVIREKSSSGNSFIVDEYENLADFARRQEAPSASQHPFRTRTIQDLTVCRDTNPMAFHIATTHLIAPGKSGFVIDRARGAEVWNQPAFRYRLQYLDLETSAPILNPDQALFRIDTASDLFAQFRAPGTVYLAQVEMVLDYTEDSGPKVRYDEEETTELTVRYTLEFDERKRLIGGEWGLIPTPRNMKDQEQARWRNSDYAPDFIWMTDPKSPPINGPIPYDLISKIHRCSTSASGVQMGQWPSNGESFSYVDCEI